MLGIVLLITGQLVQILWHLLISALLLIGLLAIACVGVLAIRLLVGSSGSGRSRI